MSQQDVLMELQRAAATDSVGAQLRQAREARGMSIESVSNAIKLAPRQVEAIESDDFGQLLSPTYARGFIRNYASLIGLDAPALLGRLDQQHVCATPQLLEQENVGVTMPNQSVRRKWLLPLIALSVPAIVVLALYMWFEFWPAAPQITDVVMVESEASTQSSPVEPLVGVPVESTPPLPDVVPLPPPEAAAESVDAASPAPVPVDAPAQPATALPGQRQLVFTFATDSWVEMRDGSEAILFSELNRSGSTRMLNATFPVSLVIGNARSVTLHIDGVPYDLAPSTKVDVARLRLE
jgi:cytoskeleton protein RodZ